jgi:hypothetical protein
MKNLAILAGSGLLIGLVTGCDTIPPGAERGPHNTMAYFVKIEASDPDVRIEANQQSVGTAPLTLKIFGDPDGTFHDFGSYYYIIQAIPVKTNQFVQTAVFRTGHLFTPEDKIPPRIYFDMNQPSAPPSAPGYGPPGYYPPPAYYPPPVYYGPRIYVGPPGYYYRYWH